MSAGAPSSTTGDRRHTAARTAGTPRTAHTGKLPPAYALGKNDGATNHLTAFVSSKRADKGEHAVFGIALHTGFQPATSTHPPFLHPSHIHAVKTRYIHPHPCLSCCPELWDGLKSDARAPSGPRTETLGEGGRGGGEASKGCQLPQMHTVARSQHTHIRHPCLVSWNVAWWRPQCLSRSAVFSRLAQRSWDRKASPNLGGHTHIHTHTQEVYTGCVPCGARHTDAQTPCRRLPCPYQLDLRARPPKTSWDLLDLLSLVDLQSPAGLIARCAPHRCASIVYDLLHPTRPHTPSHLTHRTYLACIVA